MSFMTISTISLSGHYLPLKLYFILLKNRVLSPTSLQALPSVKLSIAYSCISSLWFDAVFPKVFLITVLSNTLVTSYMRLFKLKLKLIKIKYNLNFTSTVTQAIFQVYNCPMWLVAAILDTICIGYFHHDRKFYWIALPQSSKFWVFISL